MTTRDTAVVIVAAGRGQRLGFETPKAFVEINGQSLLAHSIENIASFSSLAQLIIAVPLGHEGEAQEIADRIFTLRFTGAKPAINVVIGGSSRQTSIVNSLKVLDPEAQVILIHDAARAFASTALFESVYTRVKNSQQARGESTELVDQVVQADSHRRAVVGQFEALRAEQKSLGALVAKAQGDDPERCLHRRDPRHRAGPNDRI